MELMPQHFRSGIIVPPVIQLFAASKNMEVSQENEHRVLRHLDHQIDPLRGGPEMFIGGLPHNCFEPELIPILERFGRIYEFRLVMNSTWENRGFAYVKFCDPNFTELVQLLDKFPIRPGCHPQVNRSIVNCNLVLVGVPFNTTLMEVKEELNRISPGLESVRVAERRNNHVGVAKGFGQLIIATYLNHELTWMARDQLIFRHQRIWGERIHVEWAVQKSFNFPRKYCCPRILHVLGLSSDISDTLLFKIFAEHSKDGVSHMLRRQDQAFIFCKTQDQAKLAKCKIHATLVNGNFLYVDVVNPTLSFTSDDQPVTMEAALRVGQGAPEEDVPQLGDEEEYTPAEQAYCPTGPVPSVN